MTRRVRLLPLLAALARAAPIDEPYPALHGHNASGAPPPAAPIDPLATYTWDPAAVNVTALQRYEAPAVAAVAVSGAPGAVRGAAAESLDVVRQRKEFAVKLLRAGAPWATQPNYVCW